MLLQQFISVCHQLLLQFHFVNISLLFLGKWFKLGGVRNQWFLQELLWCKSSRILLVSCCINFEQIFDNKIMSIFSGNMKRSVTHVLGSFVDGLAFSDHDSYYVKVAIFTCSPNICKTKMKLDDAKNKYLRLNAFFTFWFLLMMNAVRPYEFLTEANLSKSASHLSKKLTALGWPL